MAKVDGKTREVLDKTEFVTILTWSEEGPHLAATWGDYVRAFDTGDDETLAFPAGGYRTTEENLTKNGNVQLLVASKQVQGTRSLGQGCIISGKAELQTSGSIYEKVKERFSWARAALVVKVEATRTLL